ncbi:unnamed protein product [Closterium sp. NIES-64]|nr:unnamed protein product [Closterium sp. NIES-64]
MGVTCPRLPPPRPPGAQPPLSHPLIHNPINPLSSPPVPPLPQSSHLRMPTSAPCQHSPLSHTPFPLTNPLPRLRLPHWHPSHPPTQAPGSAASAPSFSPLLSLTTHTNGPGPLSESLSAVNNGPCPLLLSSPLPCPPQPSPPTRSPPLLFLPLPPTPSGCCTGSPRHPPSPPAAQPQPPSSSSLLSLATYTDVAKAIESLPAVRKGRGSARARWQCLPSLRTAFASLTPSYHPLLPPPPTTPPTTPILPPPPYHPPPTTPLLPPPPTTPSYHPLLHPLLPPPPTTPPTPSYHPLLPPPLLPPPPTTPSYHPSYHPSYPPPTTPPTTPFLHPLPPPPFAPDTAGEPPPQSDVAAARELFGVSFADVAGRHFLVLRQERVVVEAESSVQTLMETLHALPPPPIYRLSLLQDAHEDAAALPPTRLSIVYETLMETLQLYPPPPLIVYEVEKALPCCTAHCTVQCPMYTALLSSVHRVRAFPARVGGLRVSDRDFAMRLGRAILSTNEALRGIVVEVRDEEMCGHGWGIVGCTCPPHPSHTSSPQIPGSQARPRIEYLPTSSLPNARPLLLDFLAMWHDLVAAQGLVGRFVPLDPAFSDYSLGDSFSLPHSALQFVLVSAHLMAARA